MSKLTAKQKAFVNEYLIDLNATQAAIRAGYSEKTANEQGARLLANVSISEFISKAMEERSKRTGITADQVLNELAMIAFANGADFAQVVEEPIIVNGRYVKDPDTGQLRKQEVVKIVPTDKLPEDKKRAIAGIKEGRYGVEVATCDKVKALELLGRHLGMFKDKVELTNLNDEKGKLDGIIAQLRG
ncbi:terminase small subunit [Anaerocolumna xylanovorans]|uniref:Phage terminase small subunit n=1 Tax=Anaerocolumna xylanovorans DSM 12503 TaxID=1121345 RepID=A0A1M7Y3K8_9FIRM|nr:terminase small subunit [Anaerocolumna xylanovorans]SHO46781.1 phage terminase small subunit [Anaerocolumna xylanovorans DSM 12503]